MLHTYRGNSKGIIHLPDASGNYPGATRQMPHLRNGPGKKRSGCKKDS